MKSILTLILATFLLIPLQAQEKVYTVDNLPKVHLQNKMQYVCNPAGILSQAACDTIDTMLHALEQQTGIETVVAIVPSIGDMECFDFCHQLLNQWGVGKKGTDNGLVILFSVIGVGIAFFAARHQSRCTKCGKHALQRTGSRLVSRVNGVKTEDVTYTCKNCGNTIIRRQQSYDSDYHNRGGGGGGPFIGGFGGSGGGFSGGSFGGGMGGGGGAGSRF